MHDTHLVVRLMLKRTEHWAAYQQKIYHTHHAGSRESSKFLEWCNSCLMNNSRVSPYLLVAFFLVVLKEVAEAPKRSLENLLEAFLLTH